MKASTGVNWVSDPTLDNRRPGTNKVPPYPSIIVYGPLKLPQYYPLTVQEELLDADAQIAPLKQKYPFSNIPKLGGVNFVFQHLKSIQYKLF